jgi:hypothetical protein
MNLQSKKARIPIAALGVTALIAGAGALASPAFAAGSLTLAPTTTDVTTLDLGAAAVAGTTSGFNLAQPLADAAYATHVSSTGLTTLSLSVDGYTAPTGVTTGTPYVYLAEKAISPTTSAGPTASAATGPWTRVTAPAVGGTAVTSSLTLASGASANNVFVTVAAPGTYTMHFVDGGTQVGTDDDSVSPTITLTVKDAGAYTASTSDDYTPAVTVPTSVGIGAPVPATVGLAPVTLADARGTSSGAGVLGAKLNALLGVAFTGVAGLAGGDTTSTAGTYGTTTTTRGVPVGRTTAGGTLTTTVAFDKNGDTTLTDTVLTTATTTVATNGVASVTLAAKDIDGSVKTTGAAVAAKPSATAISYTATVTNTTTPTDVGGKVVYFTIGGSAPNVAKLTTDGTAVDTSSTTSHVYSATTDTTGVATLKVTSSGPVAADAYTVAAASNGFSGTTLTTTYAAPAASTVKVTSTTADLTVATTSAVTITGAIYDQYGSPVTPAPSASQQAQLYIGTPASTCAVAPAAGQNTTAAQQNATVSAGTFSFTYTPATTPAAGNCVAFRIGYDADGGGTIAAGESATAQVNYASSTDAAAISITAPTEGAAKTLLTHASPVGSGQAVTGVVTDASNATVAYKSVTLTGGAGVYFSTTASPTTTSTSDDLVDSLTVVTDGSGNYTAYAFFTKAGSHKITVTSGTATKSVNVTVSDSIDPYTVKVDDVTGSPGDTLIVTGTVTDMFGNPVPTNVVDLTTGGSAVGTLGASSVTTNAQGIFSTTFTSGSNSSGDVTLTAVLHAHGGIAFDSVTGATLVPATAWKDNAGLTFDNGKYTVDGKITVKQIDLTLTAPAKVTAGAAGAKFKIHGTFKATTSVDIYGKESGSSVYQLFGSTETDADGLYSFDVQPMVSTAYLAKSSGLSSGAESVTVYSKVTLTAKALGHGMVRLTANGSPNVKGPLKFYRSRPGTDPRLASFTSNAAGGGSITVRMSKGTKRFYATFDAPGTHKGTSKIVSVKVK